MDKCFQGTLLLLAPHFDDEVLGCGGLLALLPNKQRIHILFATAGDSLPIATHHAETPKDIGENRKQESIAALNHLGIPSDQLHFLNLPEKRLTAEHELLTRELENVIQSLQPATLLLPFRFDQHPDHLALYSAGRSAAARHAPTATLLEYFVYVNYPLLPRKDIRLYCKPELLHKIDIRTVSAQKAAALNLFISQTTLFYPAQCRPVLSQTLIADYAAGPEYYLQCPPDRHPCILPAGLLQLAQQLQPNLKRIKENLRAHLGKKNQP
ncbi:MAG: PIG-L family deacetylase [Kiritimatiellae bacterium]|nr:PIG-L family deacetylase [Kiritimatiellia bacterium]MDD4736727.1 PIG-L family deacetylase [Kiritimatiellia bacterium]